MKGKPYGLYNTNDYISVSTRKVLSKTRLNIFKKDIRKAPLNILDFGAFQSTKMD